MVSFHVLLLTIVKLLESIEVNKLSVVNYLLDRGTRSMLTRNIILEITWDHVLYRLAKVVEDGWS